MTHGDFDANVWELGNNQMIWILLTSICFGLVYSAVELYYCSVMMSCVHSCRECVLPFLLSHLATIAAAKSSSFCRCKQIIHSPRSLWSFHALPIVRNRNWTDSPSCMWNLMHVCCCLILLQTQISAFIKGKINSTFRKHHKAEIQWCLIQNEFLTNLASKSSALWQFVHNYFQCLPCSSFSLWLWPYTLTLEIPSHESCSDKSHSSAHFTVYYT